MTHRLRWTSRDLESLPDDGKRYEIIDGELYLSKQPHYYHQHICTKLGHLLYLWNEKTGLGEVTGAPGLIFAEDDDVAPDVVWSSVSRLGTILQDDGKLHAAPELVIEVLSPGSRNERRDREAKLNLYSRREVGEYWIVDWMTRRIEVYRRAQGQLDLVSTLVDEDILTSPLLPGFSCTLPDLFKRIPSKK